MTLELLIASVYGRHEMLCALLDGLAPQLDRYPGQVGILLDRDDGETVIGAKRTRLVRASRAAYVAHIDDDDQVAPDYVDELLAALASRPDYVGFQVRYTVDGRTQKPVTHSLRYQGWSEDERGFYRDISHLNPIRRDAAVAALPFEGGFGEDGRWADRVRRRGMVRVEAFVPRELYWYRWSSQQSLFTGGMRRTGEVVPLAARRFVRELAQTSRVEAA